MPALAKLLDAPIADENVAWRALSANFKLGESEHATRLAKYAARANATDYLRAAALKLLADWAKPSKRDHITGLAQNLPDRDALVAVNAIRPVLAKVFVGNSVVRAEAAGLAKKLGLTDAGPLLLATVTDTVQDVNLRVDALYALDELKAEELDAALAVVSQDREAKLRGASRVVLARKDPTTAAVELPKLLKGSQATAVEKQLALQALGTLPESKPGDAALAEWLEQYLAGKVPAELKLDVLDAAKARVTADKLKLHAPLKELLKKIDTASQAAEKGDHLARYRESLAGGDAARGREIFLNNNAVYCQRCHKLDGQGGEVGPILNGLARDKTRDYLLESITHPNKQIAKGYESVQLAMLDGSTISGVLKARTKDTITVMTAEAKSITVKTDDVDGEKPDKSAMAEELANKLSRRELRDLVEFLHSMK